MAGFEQHRSRPGLDRPKRAAIQPSACGIVIADPLAMSQDLKLALRRLVGSPGFTSTAALTLTLGIGVTTLMFSVVNAVMLRPLLYPAPERLMLVFNVNTRAPESNTLPASALDFDDYRARAGAFSRMAGHVGTGFTFSGDGDPELLIGQQVTPDFFAVLGVAPAISRVPSRPTSSRPDATAWSCFPTASGSAASADSPRSSARPSRSTDDRSRWPA